MLTDVEIISQFINSSRLLLIDSQLRKGLKASGKSAAALGTTVSPTFGQLIDKAGYFFFQQFGRKAGKAPPVKAIYDWLEFNKYGIEWNYETRISKPINHVSKEDIGLGLSSHRFKEHVITPNERRMQIAFAIQHNIRLKGTHTHQHGSTNVVSDVFTKERISAMTSAFATKYAAQTKSDIVTEFKPKN